MTLINTYNSIRRHLITDCFEIKRVKTKNADNVPFHLLGEKYLFKVKRSFRGKKKSYFVSEDCIEDCLKKEGTWAMIFHAKWGSSTHLPFFVEPLTSDGFVLHTHLLVDEYPEALGDFEEDWEIISNYLKIKEKEAEEEFKPF